MKGGVGKVPIGKKPVIRTIKPSNSRSAVSNLKQMLTKGITKKNASKIKGELEVLLTFPGTTQKEKATITALIKETKKYL
jgi:hypothetical protein